MQSVTLNLPKNNFQMLGYRQDGQKGKDEMKVFSKKKFFEVEGRSDYDFLRSIGVPKSFMWMNRCDGKEPVDGMIEGYEIADEWCIEKAKVTIKDFIEKRIAVRTGTGKNLKKFLAMLEKANLTWKTGDKATEFIPDWFGENCCIAYLNNCIEYCDLSFYKKHGFKIVEVDEFESVDNYEIKISIDGDVTTAEMIVNGKVVKSAKAKRNPVDKFDFAIGAKLAFEQLFERERKEEFEGCNECMHSEEDEMYCMNINCCHAFPAGINENKPDRYKKRH